VSRLLQALGVGGLTVIAVVALLSARPFETAQSALERCFGSAPSWTQVTHVVTDPEIQEVSHGENPSVSLATLANYWKEHPDSERTVFIGNSQMFAVSLAPGEYPLDAPERTYPDLVAESLRSDSERKLCYRLAAPGMSYTEALWYAAYLASCPELHPNSIVLQLNYQSFWNGRIRDGMLEMLGRRQFAESARRLATVRQPYSDDFADAIRRYEQKKRQAASVASQSESGELTGPVLGRRFEAAVRTTFDSIPVWPQRRRHRDSFYDLMYSARIYLLHIKPSTSRSIDGTRLWRSQAALEEVARTCRENGIRLVLFNAPVNPRVSLYQSAADLERYRHFVAKLSADYGLSVHDLEAAIPGDLWGSWMNGPDPLHLGRQGHRLMASQMVRILEPALAR
jgi:hypothetical protein